MKLTRTLSHGLLRFPCGNGSLVVGRDMQFMVPSNDIYHDPPSLRRRLDDDGYLYFRGMIPRVPLRQAVIAAEQNLRALGQLPTTSQPQTPVTPEALATNEKTTMDVACGSKVMSVVHQIFGGPVKRYDYVSLDTSKQGEEHGFHMDSVFMGKGTKLFLSAWVPLTDITLKSGPLVLLLGSNNHSNTAALRSSYGQHDAYSGDVEGNGIYSFDPADVKGLGRGMVTTSFGGGDIVLFGGYTMHGYLTNTANVGRFSVESKWCLSDDTVGPDPRYVGHEPPPMAENMRNRSPMTAREARRSIWNVGVSPESQGEEK